MYYYLDLTPDFYFFIFISIIYITSPFPLFLFHSPPHPSLVPLLMLSSPSLTSKSSNIKNRKVIKRSKSLTCGDCETVLLKPWRDGLVQNSGVHLILASLWTILFWSWTRASGERIRSCQFVSAGIHLS